MCHDIILSQSAAGTGHLPVLGCSLPVHNKKLICEAVTNASMSIPSSCSPPLSLTSQGTFAKWASMIKLWPCFQDSVL